MEPGEYFGAGPDSLSIEDLSTEVVLEELLKWCHLSFVYPWAMATRLLPAVVLSLAESLRTF